jgi:hypothetical protein
MVARNLNPKVEKHLETCETCRTEVVSRDLARVEIEEALGQAESSGLLDPNCKSCAEVYEALRAGRRWPMGPSHKASPSCESGSRPHCSCDTCF